ncbi:chorismate mutase [Legionella quateirensis]|uniref:chorismate mutase n=1 Tax=Legionella quateirensis TaxID=45072 RepID=A0A378KSK9_9GAMM|nr:chorismate mutase [Legionella quateirensis]KTD42354.1 2-methylcitrate synthase [Legionella quateirensis]STY17159.1 2-methylcitrate synthase [Legionella quateirensis]
MSTIEQLRKQIQETDCAIIRSLALRQDLSKKIAHLKQQEGKSIIDINQEKKNFELYEFLAKSYSLDPNFIARLFRLIIMNSRTLQQYTICESHYSELDG